MKTSGNKIDSLQGDLQTRLEKYRQKKQEEKQKKITEIQQKRKHNAQKRDFPVSKHIDIDAKKKKNVNIDQASMREKLELWRSKQKENIDVKKLERRKTIGWAVPGKNEIPGVPTKLPKVEDARRKTLSSVNVGSRKHNQIKSSIAGHGSGKHNSKPASGIKENPTNASSTRKVLKPKPQISNKSENKSLKPPITAGGVSLKRKQSLSSSTPAVRRSSSAGSTSKAIAFSTLSAIKKISDSLKKTHHIENSSSLSQPRSRKSLFTTERERTQTLGRPPMLPLLKIPSKDSVKHTQVKRSATSKIVSDRTAKSAPPSTRTNQKENTKTHAKRKFTTVSSRIDTGIKSLKFDPTRVKNDASNQAPKAPVVKLNKAAAQRMSSLKRPADSTTHSKQQLNSGLRNRTYVLSSRSHSSHSSSVSGISRLNSAGGLTANRTSASIKQKANTVRSKSTSALKGAPSSNIQQGGGKVRRKSCLSTSKRKSGVLKSVSGTRDISACNENSFHSNRHQVRFLTPTSLSQSPAGRQYAKTPVSAKSRTSYLMRDRLNSWLESKGKTPSKFMHLMCFHDDKANTSGNVDGGLSVNELHLQQELLEKEQNDSVFEDSIRSLPQTPQANKLHNLLNECLLLLQSGCPVDNVQSWMEEIEKTHTSVVKEAKYYIVMSRIAEQKEATDAEILDIFEAAVRNNAAPPDEVAAALTEFVNRMNTRKTTQDEQSLQKTPRTGRRSVDLENIISTSTTKYSLSKTTPFFTRLRAKADGLPTPCGIVTPVRRSTRLSQTPLPPVVKDHDIVVETLDELSPDTRQNLLFQSNKALIDEFDAAVEI